MHVELHPLSREHLSDTALLARHVGWLNDDDVTKYLECRFTAWEPSTLKATLRNWYNDDNVLMWYIRITMAPFLGTIKVKLDPHHKTGELGFMLGNADHWHKGITREAVAKVVSLMDATNITLWAGVYGSHRASQRVLEANDFRLRGTLPGKLMLDGKRDDHLWYRR